MKNCAVCVVDIGSPLQGNIGWAIVTGDEEISGTELDDAIPLIARALEHQPLLLGLEAPLFVPIRENLIDATRARKGEERRPWSAGAGAQVLAMNIPIMTYLFRKLRLVTPKTKVWLNPEYGFEAAPQNMMIFEALVSGFDKGLSHEEDALIMARSCFRIVKSGKMPACIRLPDESEFLNIAGASLLYTGWNDDLSLLHQACPIYKPV